MRKVLFTFCALSIMSVALYSTTASACKRCSGGQVCDRDTGKCVPKKIDTFQ